MADSIGFDLDGTIWDSLNCTLEAWQTTAERHGAPLPDKKLLESAMGLTRIDFMKKIFPEMSLGDAQKFFAEAEDECDRLIRLHGGKIYDGVEETLAELSKRYKLYIVSNCSAGYLDAFLSYHKLGKYFCDALCENPQGLPKGENIKIAIERNGFKASVYVGDTQSDCDAARLAGIPFIHAAYGFGTAENPDFTANSFKDILTLVK